MRRLARRVLRVLRWVGLGLTVLLVLAIGGGYIYLRGPNARDRAVAMGLRELRKIIPGGVELGPVEGDLTSGLVLHDFVIYDRDHVVAVKASRLEVRYDLFALLALHVRVTQLRADGVLVVSRTLDDGRDSFATLSSAPPRSGPSVTSLPVAISVEDVAIDGRFVRLPRGTSIAHAPHDADVRLAIHGRVDVSRALTMRVDHLVLDVTAPSRGIIRAWGGLELGGPFKMRDVVVQVDADARELHHWVPSMKLQGPVTVRAEGSGGIGSMRVSAYARAAHHGLHIDTRALIGKHGVEIARADVQAPFADLVSHGQVGFDGHFRATVKANVSDLAALAIFGAPPMAGRVALAGTSSWDEHAVRLAMKGTAEELAITDTKVRSASVEIDTVDFFGHAHAQVRGLRVNDLALRTADLRLDASHEDVAVAFTGDGSEGLAAVIKLGGKPILSDGRPVGFDGQLRALQLDTAGERWRAAHPVTLRVDVPQQAVDLGRLELVDDPQRVIVEGSIRGRTIQHALVEIQHFDLSKLSAVLSPGHVLPHTDLSADANARGAFDDPEVFGKFAGEAHGRSEKDLIHASGNGEARLAKHRLAAKVFVTIGGQKASGKIDMPLPLRPNAPIDAVIDANVLLSPTFAELLVPKLIQFQPLAMYTLAGRVTANIKLTGTTSNPELHATARLANFDAAGAHGDIGLSAEYKARLLGASLTLSLSSLRGGAGTGGGIVEATAQLPIDLSAVLTGGAGRLLAGDLPLHGTVNVRHLGLDYLPWKAFNVIPAVQHGHVDAHAELGGTMSRPQVNAQLKADDLFAAGMDKLGFDFKGRLEGRAVTADAGLSVRGSEAMRVHASLDAGHNGNPKQIDWTHAALAVGAKTERFDLSKVNYLAGLGGMLRGTAELTGSLAAPHGKIDYEITNLALGASHYTAFHARGDASEDGVDGSIVAEQAGGAKLSLEARVPLHGGTVDGHLVAQRFLLDVRGDRLPGVRLVRGILDADVRLSDRFDAPSVAGTLAVDAGELRIPSTSMDYHDISALLRMKGDTIHLESLALGAGERGHGAATGKLVLSGFLPRTIAAKLTLRSFPFQQQGVGLYVDADVDIDGKRDASGALRGNVRVHRGQAQLPEIASRRGLLPIGPLEDVRVVDGRSHAKRSAEGELAANLRVGTLLDGPFLIRSKELSAVARGGVSIDLSGDRPSLKGSIHTDKGGWIMLFGRRYDLERGRVTWTGDIDPVLDFRIARRMSQATVGADVEGSAYKPTIGFWSDPPMYTPTQVAGVILSGDPGSNGVSTAGLERQTVGAISSLLVTSIKQNLVPELPLDVFRFDGKDMAREAADGSQIDIGKYLTESLYVGYAYQLDANKVGAHRSNHNETRLQYRMPRSLQLEGESGDEGGGGVDLYWTWRP